MGPEPSSRRILLVDCDAFYVQVARLLDPEGAGRTALLIVGGSATGRGVVTSASYEARAFGVRSAMPTRQALELCPQATVVPVPRSACVEKSEEVRSVLEDLSPVVQAASIDEFYLDLSGTERLFHGEAFEATARRIRETVLARTSVSVSVGGGSRRFIAKLAASRAKPAGVRVVPDGGERAFLDSLDLSDLTGVGPAFAAELSKRGLVRVRDAAEVQLEWLQRWFGTRRGAWLYARVHGVDESEVDARESRKSISSERTFSHDLDRDALLERRLLELVESVGGTLRKKGFSARTLTVKVRASDFSTRQRARTVDPPIESDTALYKLARSLLRELRSERGGPVRLLGVGVGGLAPSGEGAQLAFFDTPPTAGETERDRTVAHTVDRLRGRFGDRVVRPGRLFEDRDADESR